MARALRQPISHERHWKQRLVQEIDADLKQRHASTIRHVRAAITKVRKEGHDRLARARARCPAVVAAKIAKARDWYAKRRAELSERYRTVKQAARRTCRERRAAIVAQVLARTAPLQEQLGETRSALAELRRQGRRARPTAGRSTAAERRGERDEEVEREILSMDPALVPVWQRLKKQFRGGPHIRRAEEFFHFVEEEPEAVQALQVELAEADIRDLERRQLEEYTRHHRRAKESKRRASRPAVVIDSDEDAIAYFAHLAASG